MADPTLSVFVFLSGAEWGRVVPPWPDRASRAPIFAALEEETRARSIALFALTSDGRRLAVVSAPGASSSSLVDRLARLGSRVAADPHGPRGADLLRRGDNAAPAALAALSSLLSPDETLLCDDGRSVLVLGAGVRDRTESRLDPLRSSGWTCWWEQRQESFRVVGMTCSSCVRGIETQVSRLAGVSSVEVSLLTEKARVSFAPFQVSSAAIVDAVEAIGFEASSLGEVPPANERDFQCHLLVPQSGGALLEYDLHDVKGVKSSRLDASTSVLQIRFDPELIQPRQLSSELSRLGYQHDFCLPSAAPRSESQSWLRLLAITTCFSAPLLAMHAAMIFSASASHALMMTRLWGISLSGLLGFALATPVQFYSGRRFYVAAYKGLRHCTLGMDFLVACGTSLTWLASVSLMVVQSVTRAEDTEYYFETTSTLLTFVVMGKALESRAKRQTASGLESLLAYHPKHAVLVEATGEEREIPVELIQLGDLLKVVPGDLIPADGEIESGCSNVDQSIITGESVPVTRGPSDFVYGGTTCCDGMLTLRVLTLDGDSTLAHITRFIEQAQSSKPPIQRVADRISSYFGVSVLSLAVLTFVVWYALCRADAIPRAWYEHTGSLLFSALFGISVLVIACPCALGLATPTAIMVGTGLGARHGILIKSGEALEASSRVDTIVLDKTGTITCGRPAVVEFRIFVSNLSESAFFGLMGSVERGSDHPLSKGILEFCRARGIDPSPPESVESVIGSGLRGRVDGHEVRIGTRPFVESELSAPLPEAGVQYALKWTGEGQTLLFCGVDGRFAGMIGLSDVLKPEVPGAMALLRASGYELHLCSGDTLATVAHVASEAGITRYVGEVTPQRKAEYIRALQEQGHRVAFVGDGVNDSPAIAQAELGISVSQGTDIAIEVAQIILMKSDMGDLVTALDLSKRVYRKIKMNFAWALIYNLLAIPAASGLLFPLTHARVPPAVAGLLMAASSVSVVLSSLALRCYRPPRLSPS